jgi:hypothetical protein
LHRHLSGAVREATVDGLGVRVLPSEIRRIVVIGDTGCPLKGTLARDCNDPVKWPFAVVACLAAPRRPDLVFHVHHYLYRKSACPDDRPGCLASPYGDSRAAG